MARREGPHAPRDGLPSRGARGLHSAKGALLTEGAAYFVSSRGMGLIQMLRYHTVV